MFTLKRIILTAIILLFPAPITVLANMVTSFTLVNADTNADIHVLSDGETLNLAVLPSRNINIRANTSPSTVDSVSLSLTGATSASTTEGVAPYALWGDSNGNYASAQLNIGGQTLSAIPTLSGATGTQYSISFTVVDNESGIPVANAGEDRYVFLPDNQIELTGHGTDSDGTITAYHWQQRSGPSTAVLSNENSAIVTLSSLVLGTYSMRLTITDNDNNTDYDDVFIHVVDQTTSNNLIYFEQNGVLVMEAERGTPETTDEWVVATDVSDYRGNGFIRWEGNNFFSNKTHGIQAYTINITNGGDYHIRLRAFHDPASHGETSDQENDCWTNHQINSNTALYKTFRNSGQAGQPWSITGTWEPTHGSFTQPIINLQPGIHTFRIAARSKNFMIDRIYLAQNRSDVNEPMGESPFWTSIPVIRGELKKWHNVSLTFNGPETSETATPNPFTDYRFNVTFTNGAKSYTVPGYFAADGDAANTSASTGHKWRVHFSPDEIGEWTYTVSFRTGTDVAGSADPIAGTAVPSLDGQTGSFTIAPTDKRGRDNRGKGRLRYVGKHHLQFAETQEYFLKQGADAPENFLAYEDFDNTPDYGGRRKTWSSHITDWQQSDPTWQSNKGKGIIGAINYLASEGMNAFSFIPMNIDGDDRNVFPYISDNASDRTRFDCSKLDQWEIVFSHADTLGMFLHFKTQETENELLLNNGDMGLERKLYYRELIARYSHHLALNWNLGEEINDATTAQKQAWAEYFHDNDPYTNHIVIHNMGNPHYDLLGSNSELTGFSLQTSNANFSAVHTRVKDYLTRSQNAGKPWAVACDEPGDASHALRPDNDAGNSHEDGRKNGLWGTLMAGGWGNEWYFGYQHDHSDLTCEDFRSRDNWWDYCRIALNFFNDYYIPFWAMTNDNDVISNNDDYCFMEENNIYLIYLKNGGTTDIDLRNAPGNYVVKWYDTRNEGVLMNGTAEYITGGSWISIGYPPEATDQDWAVIIRKVQDGDSDDDSIPDSWEIGWFGSLQIANDSSDYDQDGYSDRQEYLNYLAGVTDPEGNFFNPLLINSPGGAGYHSNFWLLILPAIMESQQ